MQYRTVWHSGQCIALQWHCVQAVFRLLHCIAFALCSGCCIAFAVLRMLFCIVLALCSGCCVAEHLHSVQAVMLHYICTVFRLLCCITFAFRLCSDCCVALRALQLHFNIKESILKKHSERLSFTRSSSALTLALYSILSTTASAKE